MPRNGETIFEVLQREHRQVSELFEKLQGSADGVGRSRLFETLRKELEAHAEAESDTLYEVLKQHEQTQDQVLEGEQEHHVVKTLLRELDQVDSDGEVWQAKLEVLKENVEHHVAEEEGELFGAARDLISEEQAEYLAERFLDAKEERMG